MKKVIFLTILNFFLTAYSMEKSVIPHQSNGKEEFFHPIPQRFLDASSQNKRVRCNVCGEKLFARSAIAHAYFKHARIVRKLKQQSSS